MTTMKRRSEASRGGRGRITGDAVVASYDVQYPYVVLASIHNTSGAFSQKNSARPSRLELIRVAASLLNHTHKRRTAEIEAHERHREQHLREGVRGGG